MSMEYGIASVLVLCPKLVISNNEPGFQWLIGSPSFPTFTIVSTFKCIHNLSQSPFSPDIAKESGDLRMLISKGFSIVGALIVGVTSCDLERIAVEAVGTLRRMRKAIGAEFESREIIGAVGETAMEDIRFFVSGRGDSNGLDVVNSVTYDDHPDNYVWERGCLLFCNLPLKLPLYSPMNGQFDVSQMYSRVIKSVSEKFKDPQTAYVVEALNQTYSESSRPLILHGVDLDFDTGIEKVKLASGAGDECDAKYLSCSYFCSKNMQNKSFSPFQSADIIHVSVLHNRSSKSSDCAVPIAEYNPALEETGILVVEFQLNVLCYAAKDLLLTHAISKLIIPALVDQLDLMKSASSPIFLTQIPKIQPYHFVPCGSLIPITVFYELGFGETEIKQVEVRRALHFRLGLPLDRPLLRVANALNFSSINKNEKSNTKRKGISMLRDVHVGIPSSGVSSGVASLIQGSYEYHHYLQDGFNDSGWGCAYRSLQTIISWFKLQHYTSIDIPSHREIQKTLVDICDKDPSFIGSCEWIGAIELSFVLDKLLGVSSKIINVRSGAELPEKCRELSLHFESQGTPIMIGGGVLAYTLLGVDYNNSSGDCAFLILDPHYTGNDDLKKIINGGWCAWKKGVDSKGKHFFLHHKFYNLLLPQRPTMV